MTEYRTHVATPGPARKFAREAMVCLFATGCAASLLLAGFRPAQADVVLYQATVPLRSPAEADRDAAFGEALKVAAVRASGRSDAGAAPAVARAAAAPTSYIQQYSTTTDRMLKVGFDGRAMEQLLQQAGLPLWPAERPVTTVYLFVPAIAGGARAVTAAERPPERAEIERAAAVRGVPLAWPADSVDLATARTRIAGAGQKAAALLGVPGTTGFDWTFAHAGQSARGPGGLASGLGLAADNLASRYAPGSTRSVRTVSIAVGGLTDVRAYAALTKYLEGLSLVRSVSLRTLSGSTAQLALEVRGDLELLRRIVALDGRLQPVTQGDNSGEVAEFTWQS
jgi:hypothetical protein